MNSLRERQEKYEEVSDQEMLPHLPVIIRLNIKNYKKISEELDKPYSVVFGDLMAETLLYVITSIQDAVFGFTYQDEINIVLRNDLIKDTKPWFNNNVQKIVSTVASAATLGFIESQDLIENEEILDPALFEAKVFAVPSLPEVVNYLVLRQSYCMGNALTEAVSYELAKKIGKAKTHILLKDKSYSQKKDILLQKCGIDFIDFYPKSFYRGMAAYKEPTLVPTRNGSETKNKWLVNDSIPNFVEDKDFVLSIITNGKDIFRGRSFI